MAIEPGTRVGHYDILAAIGRGGMGEVWKARDTRLGREVAIKALPSEFADDSDRLARLEREARLLATLNHPNIAAIYGLEEHQGSRFLVLELVEGDTLAGRLKRGAIPVGESLRLGLQIAEALEAAHEKGVIHRDLKPANIKITADGKVKVLDFGLAKALARDEGDASLSNSPTLSMAATQQGIVLGTAAYMSPEQARGRPVDKRTDIWALGCVLTEMLTGRGAFRGDDVSDVLASVLKLEPDWSGLPASLNPKLKPLLERCLEKDVRQRYQDVGDVRVDVQKIAAEPLDPPERADAQGVGASFRAAVIVAAVAAVAAVVFASLWLRPPPEVVRFSITAPPGSRLPLATPAISGDGVLAYVVADEEGVSRIHVRPLDQIESRPLTGTEGAIHPFWSVDGLSLAFASPEAPSFQLKRIDLTGGLPQDLAPTGAPAHGSWGPDDEILFLGSGGVSLIPARGGSVTRVDGPEGATFPVFLPDGERYLTRTITGDGSSIELRRLGSAGSKIIVENALSAPVVAPTPGGRTYLLYAQGSNLVAQELDLTSEQVVGEPRIIVRNVGMLAAPSVQPAVGASSRGILAYQTADPGPVPGQLVWLDRSGRTVRTVASEVLLIAPRLSPDESLVAGSTTSGGRDIYVIDARRGISERITFEDTQDDNAVWSNDDTRLAFRRAGAGIYSVDLEASRNAVQLTDMPGRPTSWSPDGESLLFEFEGRLHMLDVDSPEEEPVVLGTPNGRSGSGRFSPGGDYVAFVSDQSGRNEVYVQPVPPGAGAPKRVSLNGGDNPRWRGDGREIFFTSQGAMMAAAFGTDDFSIGEELEELFPYSSGGGFDVSRDGQEFVFSNAVDADVDAPITVVLDWWVELEDAR